MNFYSENPGESIIGEEPWMHGAEISRHVAGEIMLREVLASADYAADRAGERAQAELLAAQPGADADALEAADASGRLAFWALLAEHANAKAES